LAATQRAHVAKKHDRRRRRAARRAHVPVRLWSPSELTAPGARAAVTATERNRTPDAHPTFEKFGPPTFGPVAHDCTAAPGSVHTRRRLERAGRGGAARDGLPAVRGVPARHNSAKQPPGTHAVPAPSPLGMVDAACHARGRSAPRRPHGGSRRLRGAARSRCAARCVGRTPAASRSRLGRLMVGASPEITNDPPTLLPHKICK